MKLTCLCAALCTAVAWAAVAQDAPPFDPALRWQALRTLREGLASEEFWPSMHAAEALTQAGRGDVVLRKLAGRLTKETNDQHRCGLAREQVRAGAKQYVAVMAAILANKESNGRIHAAESLYKVHQVGERAAMRAALDEGDPKLELMAAAALVRQGDKPALERVRAYLAHSDPGLRRLAAWILGRLGDRSDWPALKKAAASDNDPVRHSFILNALAQLQAPGALDQVAKNLTHSSTAVRTYAAQTVGDCRGLKWLPELTRMLRDPNLDTRIRAAQSILVITGDLLDKDSDADGIPDLVERELGTPIDSAEPLEKVYEGPHRKLGRQDPEQLPPHLLRISFCHVGAQRYLWQLEFDRPFDQLRTVLHLYADLDNDTSTGRKSSGANQGVDMMYSFVNARNDPRFFHRSIRVNPKWPVRGIALGSRIWVCDDVALATADGRTNFRMHVLSERWPPVVKRKVGRSTKPQLAKAKLHRQRPVPKLPIPQMQGFRSLPPSYGLRHKLRNAGTTALLDPADGAIEGFALLCDGKVQGSDYTPGTAAFVLKIEGRYRVAFYASSTRGKVAGATVKLNGQVLGSVAIPAARHPGTLFYSVKPVEMARGSRLVIEANAHAGGAWYQQFMLITTEPTFPPLEIAHVETAVLPVLSRADPERTVLSWTTNRPAVCTLTFTPSAGAAIVVPEGRGAVENHRFVLPEKMKQQEHRVVIAAAEVGRAAVRSKPARVPLMRPKPAKMSRRPGRIELRVEEPLARGRRAWPVLSGVPLPPQTLDSPERCRLLDSRGRAVPSQFRAVAYWPQGGVKWLHVDFIAATKAQAAALYTLEYNVAPQPTKSPLSVQEDAAAIHVDTGAIQVHLAKAGFDPLAFVQAEGRRLTQPTGEGLSVADGEGLAFASALCKPTEWAVEEAGPVRATVRVRGAFGDGEDGAFMAYLCRLHFYTGQPWVRLVLSIDNDVVASRMSFVSEAALVAKLAGPTRCRFGFGPESTKLGRAAAVQDYDNRCLLRAGKDRLATDRAPGFCALDTDAGPVVAAVRDFWQLYPKGFDADREGLRVLLLPKLPPDQYQNTADQALMDRLYYWCDKGRYKLRTGVRVTTEVTFDFGSTAAPAAFCDQVQHPLFAACTPEHYCGSGVAGPLVPRRPGAFERYEQNLDRAFAEFLKRREKVREYGFMNYGDWYGERKWNWGNIEYDTQHALALNFMRTGRLAMLWRADDAEAHNADVDTVHHDASPRNVGRVYTHCLGHTGGYLPPGWKGMSSGFANGPRSMGHTWARGHFLLWALLGEPRYRGTGDAIAGHIATHVTQSTSIGRSRSGGWALIATTGAYQVTGDPFYLNAARILARKIMEKQRPNGQWGHHIWECRDVRPVPWGCKPFMTGVILHGLSMYDRIEPTPEVEDTIRRGARYLWKETYVHRDRGFVYAEAPRFMDRGGKWTLCLNGDGLARGCALDPEHRDRGLLLEATSHYMHQGVSSFGKSITQAMCFTPYMLKELTDLGITALPKPRQAARVWVRRQVVLPVAGRMTLRPRVSHDGDAPVHCTLAFGKAASRWIKTPASALTWDAPPGLSYGPVVAVRSPQEAATVRVPVRIECAELKLDATLTIEAVAAAKPGRGVGWVTAENDHLRLAAEKLGAKPAAIEDVAGADLSRFRTIVLGAEAHEKDYAHCRTHGAKLLRFVAAGGRLVCGQLNDGKWQPDFLPYDLHLDDADTESGPIAAAAHPLFNTPNKLPALAGVTSYDRIGWAGPEWRVLMKAKDGTPAIVEAEVGRGRVLVVMPSFDRPVHTPSEEPRVTRACAAFVENLMAYAAR